VVVSVIVIDCVIAGLAGLAEAFLVFGYTMHSNESNQSGTIVLAHQSKTKVKGQEKTYPCMMRHLRKRGCLHKQM